MTPITISRDSWHFRFAKKFTTTRYKLHPDYQLDSCAYFSLLLNALAEVFMKSVYVLLSLALFCFGVFLVAAPVIAGLSALGLALSFSSEFIGLCKLISFLWLIAVGYILILMIGGLYYHLKRESPLGSIVRAKLDKICIPINLKD